MPGGLKFDFTFGASPPSTRREPDSPLRILVLGDLTGEARASGEPTDLSRRSVIRVDVDSFDRALGRFGPQVTFVAGDGQPGGKVAMTRLDHFHPDELYNRLELFQGLRETRERLKNPATFAAAAAELRQNAVAPEVLDDTAETMRRPALKLADDDSATINRLLGEKPAAARSGGSPGGAPRRDLQSLIRSVVAPYIVSNDMPFQEQYLAAVDAAAGEQMRALLHQHAFQSLEANWRGIRMLVDALDLDGDVRLELVDITKKELRADLETAGRNLQASTFHRLLAGRAQGAPEPEAWSLLVGLYAFDSSESDVAMLAAIGSIAAQNGAPFLAAAEPSVVGCRSLVDTPESADWKTSQEAAERWQALRSAPFASWIALAMPRVLLRQPYGKATDATEKFAFEELGTPVEHEHLLWGNPALACTLLLGRSFMEEGWQMEPGGELEIDDLPAFTRTDDEKRLQACAEAFIGERAAQAVLDRGVMPFLSFRNRNAVRVMRMQSLASPPAPISGSWRSDTN